MDLDTRLDTYRIWPLWQEIVGDRIAGKAQPERLRNRILFVRVSSSTWMQQLQTMKPMLLERIHRVVKGALIKEIRFSLGEVLPPCQTPPEERDDEKEKQETTLSAEMEGHLEQIEDGELRALVRRIMLKQAQAARPLRGDEG
ncbi:MAG: DUF721 domain-containing protein [Deltaproteobacteria bacterium]|nr:DUF721 domain-containing protein [Deltaproteobacteria bacterium]MBW2120786.1 DUF721 domain-containing protein [Deltaproteobacteria bacterium]